MSAPMIKLVSVGANVYAERKTAAMIGPVRGTDVEVHSYRIGLVFSMNMISTQHNAQIIMLALTHSLKTIKMVEPTVPPALEEHIEWAHARITLV